MIFIRENEGFIKKFLIMFAPRRFDDLATTCTFTTKTGEPLNDISVAVACK